MHGLRSHGAACMGSVHTVHGADLDDDGAVGRHVIAHELVVAERARLPAGDSACGLPVWTRGSAGAARSWACLRAAVGPCCRSADPVHAVPCIARHFACRCARHARPAALLPQGPRGLRKAGGSDKAGQSVRRAVQQPARDSKCSKVMDSVLLAHDSDCQRLSSGLTALRAHPGTGRELSRRRRPGQRCSGAAASLGHPVCSTLFSRGEKGQQLPKAGSLCGKSSCFADRTGC